jgi:hypothetical protein
MSTSQTSTFLLLLLTVGVCSCMKKELPVPAHEPGNVITTKVNLDATYKFQMYFNLKTNTIVGQNLKTEWDLGCEATADGYHIVLNTAKSMFAMNTGSKDFTAIAFKDTAGFANKKKWDSPTGSLDSTAIGDWRTGSNVYIVDRGYNELGQSMGYEKVQFLAVSDTSYTVLYASLKEAEGKTLSIRKDSTYNFSFLSFDSGGRKVMVEPPKAEWDLVFTQYTHIFYDLATPYLVTGCLQNRYHTTSLLDTPSVFSEIAFGSVTDKILSPAINTIGYDWKSFNGTKYTTDPKMNYIIKDAGGRYYKLHFTDFYNASGIKGNPNWEYQQL